MFRAADTVDFLPVQGDMKFYNDWALRILGGQWTDHQTFYGLPGYAYWLALVYAVVGYQPYAAVFLQALAQAGTATLLFRLGSLAFGRRDETETLPVLGQRPAGTAAGLLAALGWMTCAPAQAYATVLMPTCYFIAAFWFVVWWTLRRWRDGRPSLAAFGGLGLFMGVVAMMVANILFLVPLVLAALCLRREWAGTVRARAASAACLLGGVLLGSSPCALHNRLIAHDPVYLSAHSGINFFVGNNPLANGYPKVPPPLHTDQRGMLRDSILWAEQAAGHPLKRSEVSAYWSGRAGEFIHGQPLAWGRLLLVKLGNFWNGFEYDDLGVFFAFREGGVLLPGPGFALAALLGLPGLVLAVARRPRARWVAAAVALHMGSVLTVFVTERYRLAAVPGLLLLGSFGVVELARAVAAGRGTWARRASWRTHGPLLGGCAAACLVAAVLGHRPVDLQVRYVNDFNSAVADIENGQLDRAERKLTHVLAGNPANAETLFALGNVWMTRGDRERAKFYYRKTLQIDGHHHRGLNNLGVMAMQERRWPLAELFLARAFAAEPDDAKTCYLLAQTRRERDDLRGASLAIDEARRISPDDEQINQFRRDLAARLAAAPSVPLTTVPAAPLP